MPAQQPVPVQGNERALVVAGLGRLQGGDAGAPHLFAEATELPGVERVVAGVQIDLGEPQFGSAGPQHGQDGVGIGRTDRPGERSDRTVLAEPPVVSQLDHPVNRRGSSLVGTPSCGE